MPKKQWSRSLFASLPPTLRASIRSQPADNFPPTPPTINLSVKQELINDVVDGLLPTQPSDILPNGESSKSPIQIDKTDQEEVVEDGEITVLGKRPIEAVSTPYVSERTTVIPINRANKRKGKERAMANSQAGHPWDCTGLIPRYRTRAEVPRHLVKYFAQRHLLFPKYDVLPLLLDDTGWFSITPQPIAAQIADRCACDVIVDAFCGVGGNSIEFVRTCERVIAIDNDVTRLNLARHNALHHGVAERIEFVLADFTDWARSYTLRPKSSSEAIDVVFLSPPWGGPGYLTSDSFDPSVMSKYPLSATLPIHGKDLFDLATELTPNIAYFLPRNTNITEVSQLARPLRSEARVQGRDREWVEVEEEWVGDKLKAITAYFGDLVASE